MKNTKNVIITGFALFSMFFGAGNLILPPFLGKNAGSSWLWVAMGFFITAVVIPFFGILAHAKLQGTMYDFGKKVSSVFSFAYCIVIYLISVVLPSPRTASVTFEMAVQPYFSATSLTTSTFYFTMVFLLVINRAKVIYLLGKFITPLVIFILLTIIFIGILYPINSVPYGVFEKPFAAGLLEGYQTFDAIGAVVVGGTLVISTNINKEMSFKAKRNFIVKAGIVAGLGLLLIYTGLIYNGALLDVALAKKTTRVAVLVSLSMQTLGNTGVYLLSVLVALACFTTATGIVMGTADYFKGLFNNSEKAYRTAALTSCIIGIIVGQLEVKHIIHIALPVLMLFYPITIVLIVLNVLPDRFSSSLVFKAVITTTFIFSIFDSLHFIIDKNQLDFFTEKIPFAKNKLGWVLPNLLVFLAVNILERFKSIRLFSINNKN
ncbi:MAG: branched-chain amino acid transport system II carrier protein [Tenacibaculum sp.]